MAMSPLILPLLFTVAAAVDTGYNESLARDILMPLASAAYADNPQPCLTNRMPGSQLNRRFELACDSTNKNLCSAYTWVDVQKKVIGLVFRGTNTDEQFEVELPSMLAAKPKEFQTGGRATPYFNDAFFALWNGGIGTNVQEMAKQHPDFDFWITGHSLGGSLAAIAAAHISASGVHPSSKVILYTFGQPRIGDARLAHYIDSSIRAYRVVHFKDLAPHLPFQSQGYQHHGTEIFYDNAMQHGAPFVVCKGGEDETCSGKYHVIELNLGQDHVHYFGENILAFGSQGCVKAARQPSG